jgi:N-acetyl-gamma-glutamyl-phosphate reductase
MIRALILGASGYGGGELLRWLAMHPSVEGIRGTSRRHAGQPFGAVHPNLTKLINGEFDAEPDWAWLHDCEYPVVFAAMPHGEFAPMYASWPDGFLGEATVIDLSADFRIADPDLYADHYKKPHPCPELLSQWNYGLADVSPPVDSRRIANPGCFATALQIGLLPLVGQDVDFVAISGVTGSSGSGMNPGEGTHHPTRAHDFRAYKPLAHQHMAEVEQFLVERDMPLEVAFVPHSAPLVRGISITIQFRRPPGWSVESIAELYEDCPFVRVRPELPRLLPTIGSNFVDIGAVTQGNLAAIGVSLDNLAKGMASQAVQNMNLAIGLQETTGLWSAGGYPG